MPPRLRGVYSPLGGVKLDMYSKGFTNDNYECGYVRFSEGGEDAGSSFMIWYVCINVNIKLNFQHFEFAQV